MALLVDNGGGFRVLGRSWLLGICALLMAVWFVSPEVLAAGNLPPTRWFPLEAGNVWILQSTNGDTRIINCFEESRSRFLVRGLFAEDVQLRGNSSRVLFGLGAARSWQPLLRFNRRDGRRWGFNLTGESCAAEQASWHTNKETLGTPAGAFAGCRHLRLAARPALRSTCGAVDPAELWLAPDIGPVGLQSANGDLYLLSSATVGGQSLPAATNGVVATLASDQAAYVNLAFGVICPPCVTATPPCEVACRLGDPVTATAHFTFVVINQSAEPVTFTFPTTQRFDIDLIDQAGVVVKAWSDRQAFGNVVTTVTMQPGQTNTFAGDILLADRQGTQLGGLYVAKAFLTDSVGPAVQATTVIRVTIVEPQEPTQFVTPAP